jgi:hypothetical protein
MKIIAITALVILALVFWKAVLNGIIGLLLFGFIGSFFGDGWMIFGGLMGFIGGVGATTDDAKKIKQPLSTQAQKSFKSINSPDVTVKEKTWDSWHKVVDRSSESKVTKEQPLNIINELEKNPEDKGRILGDVGITVTGAALGAGAAMAIAGAAGATSIFGLTTVASWLGVTVVAATPIGWIIGCAAAGGAALYGISRMVHDGGLSEGRKLELLQKYKEDARNIDVKERAGRITDEDRTKFIISMKELIDKDAISPVKAKNLIEQVEQGRIPLSQAFSLIQSLLQEKQA